MKIIHISDIHACTAPDSFSAFFDKRIIGFFNYLFRRRFQHKIEYLNKCVEYILNNPPDVIVCTGDLSSTSQPAEFEIVKKILKPIFKLDDVKFLCVPGNHDVYVKNTKCQEALQETLHTLNYENISTLEMPRIVRVGRVELMLCDECCPTNIFLSTGKMTAQTVMAVEEWGRDDRNGSIKILVGHFPLKHKYGAGGFRHRLYGHHTVRDLLDERKIALSLCGHIHSGYSDIDDKGYGEICAGSLTRFGRMAEIVVNESSGIFSHKFIKL